MDVSYNNMFIMQQKISASISESFDTAHTQLAWRDFSQETLVAAVDLFNYGEYLLNAYDNEANEKARDQKRDLGLKVMALSGKVYEQVGLAYDKGVRHKHAAEAWKYAAKASSLVLAHNEEGSVLAAYNDYYRLQSAARLHRASYHWMLGVGVESEEVEESLAEAQKYMDNGESLSSLVEEQRRINAAKPYWKK